MPWTFAVGLIGIYKIFYLYSNRLIFKGDFLIFPGPFGKSCQYKKIARISLEGNGRFLNLEIVNEQNLELKRVRISGLNKESAAALWTQLATKAKNAKIDNRVRDILVNWRYRSFYSGNPEARISFISSTDSESNSASNQAIDLESTLVPVKPSNQSLLLKFNEHSRYSQMSAYLQACGPVALRCWAGVWVIAGVVAAVSYLLSAGLDIRESVQNLVGCIFIILALPIYFIVSTSVAQLTNIYATILLFAMTLGFVAYLALKENEANTIVFDDLGLVLLRTTSFSQNRLRSVAWTDITAVKMVVPQSSSGKQRGAAIEIVTTDRKKQSSIKIPIGAFTSTLKRNHFLELLTNLNEAAELDGLVLETLSPRAEDSYTSLWLCAIEAAPQLEQLLPLSPGSRLKHHNLVIEKQFSCGGQAVTYLATLEDKLDSTSNQQNSRVILKEFLLPLFIDSARKKAIERFHRDAILLKNLDHPQIVKLHNFFIEDSRAFLMLEYIEGISLKEKIDRDGKQSEHQAINLARQMATILSYLHSCTPPVVHRDFTPENLILSAGGVLKLIDFDVALEADQLNGQNNAAGKTHYLPPEQFRGQPCPQSDIYAMGATLFYITTATDPEPMQRNRPQTVVPEISTSLDKFIATCTEPEAERRYQTASELIEIINTLQT